MPRESKLSPFGEWLQGEMKHRGLTQTELAEKSKISRQYISALSRGLRNPTHNTIEKLAKALLPDEHDDRMVDVLVEEAKTSSYLSSSNHARLPSLQQIEHKEFFMPYIGARFDDLMDGVRQMEVIGLRDDIALVMDVWVYRYRGPGDYPGDMLVGLYDDVKFEDLVTRVKRLPIALLQPLCVMIKTLVDFYNVTNRITIEMLEIEMPEIQNGQENETTSEKLLVEAN